MKVFVGNLPWTVDDDKLKSLFEKYGEIEDFTVIIDKFSRRSKGFGFVTFGNDENAKKAISELNDKEIEGRKIVVNEAKPMDPDRPRRSFGGGDRDRGGGGDRGGGFRRRF